MKLQRLQQSLHWMLRVANHDFCPGWNWLTDWLKQPLGWVVISIVCSFLIGLFIGPQGYVMAFAFLTLLVLGLAWPWLSMKGIHCQLLPPDRRVEENQELVVTFRVRNFWPLPVFGLMIKGDFLQESDEEIEPVAFSLKRVGAWSESEFRIPITPRRRGQLPTGKVTVASGFPFGLMDIGKTVIASHPALVWPASVPLEGFPVSDSTRFCLQGALRDRTGNDGDSIGVRVYRVGDRLRNIHWAQSVRSQKLMVRERQTIASTGVTVALDLSPGDHDGRDINSSYEWTIRIAASICSHVHETHSPVQIVCCGLTEQTPWSANNRNGLRPIMDFLANLPTLLEAKKSVQSSRAHGRTRNQHPAISGDGRLFFIGPNRSLPLQPKSLRSHAKNVTPVIVNVDGFCRDGKLSTPEELAGLVSQKEQRQDSSEPIFIAAPQSAATELASGWNRSFGDAC